MKHTYDCHSCDYSGNLRGLSQHWRFKTSHRPKFSDRQIEILTGLLMGDGSIKNSPSNSKIQCNSISKEYLDYLYSEFYPLSSEPKLRASAEELAKKNRESGFDDNANAKTYSDSYFWHTVTHPQLSKFNKWYSNGNKVWPKEVSLTPTVMKHWYVGDGHYNKPNSRIQIGIDNEAENKSKIDNYFNKIENISVDNWNKYERDNRTACIIQFHKDTTQKLFEYMGDPLPGFEYKWPKDLNTCSV